MTAELWRTGNPDVDTWTAAQHARGKHSNNCPPGCPGDQKPPADDGPTSRLEEIIDQELRDADEPPAEDDGVSDLHEQFWTARPVLAHIRRFAHARMVAPWPVLGLLLLRCAHHIPPWHTLPPLIGGPGSLNLFVAAVARSGGGKSSAEAAATDCIRFGSPTPMFTSRLGSGEGIARTYAHYDSKSRVMIMDRDAVLWTCGEVTELGSLSNRRGATLLPQLREAFTGERLGFGYADRDKAIQLEPHSYRFGLFVAVQTRLSGILFDDADAGTPQRFLWLPATDPTISDDPPPEPSPMQISVRSTGDMTVPTAVAEQIRQAHASRHRGDGDALDGHALFVRLKVAQILAVMDERTQMRDDDWDLAGIVTAVSDHTRERAQAEVSRAATERLQAQGRGDGLRRAAAENLRAEKMQRVGRRSLRLIQDAGSTGVPWGKLQARTRDTDRPLLQEALDNLTKAGLITEETGPKGGAWYVDAEQ